MITKKTELEKRQLPSEFTNISMRGPKISYDSLELCKKNAKLRHSLNEIYVLSFETVMKLIDDVRIYIGCLYKVCEGIAMLDMVASFLISNVRYAPLRTLLQQWIWVTWKSSPN
jgi:DNA mismatch repair protein MSH4